MSTGTNNLNGTVYSENLELSGTTLVSSGFLSGAFSWTAATIDAVLPFNIPSNSILTIGNGFNNTKFLNGDLTNAGTIIRLPTGSLQLGGLFHNLGGGLFDIHGDVMAAPQVTRIHHSTFAGSLTCVVRCGGLGFRYRHNEVLALEC